LFSQKLNGLSSASDGTNSKACPSEQRRAMAFGVTRIQIPAAYTMNAGERIE
jgi:hypothetical protein